VRLRAAVARSVLGLVSVALAVLSGDLSFGRGDEQRYRPNALLIGFSIRDLRLPATARFAEALDTNPVMLYLLGARAHVDVRTDGMNLIGANGSGIDVLTWADGAQRLAVSERWGARPEVRPLLRQRSTLKTIGVGTDRPAD
jgi:hypothetical protein